MTKHDLRMMYIHETGNPFPDDLAKYGDWLEERLTSTNRQITPCRECPDFATIGARSFCIRKDKSVPCDGTTFCQLNVCSDCKTSIDNMEQNFNSVQHLRSEITAIADLIDHANLGIEFLSYKDIATKLRRLSVEL